MLTELENVVPIPTTLEDINVTDDYSADFFFDQADKLYEYTRSCTAYSDPSPQDLDQSGSMTSSPVSDLLDLDDFQTSWQQQDPEWLPDAESLIAFNKPMLSNSNDLKSLEDISTSTASNSQSYIPQPRTYNKRKSSSSCSESEIQIEMEQSTKRAKRCTTTLSEEQKKLRRKELNRLAAQRCRNKRRGHAEILEEEIEDLTKRNKELREKLESLTSTKDELYDIIKFHFSNCHGNAASTSQ